MGVRRDYLPVEPESGIVHRYANPDHPMRETTVCGLIVPWVRTAAFIEPTAPLCAVCDPFPVTGPVTTTTT